MCQRLDWPDHKQGCGRSKPPTISLEKELEARVFNPRACKGRTMGACRPLVDAAVVSEPRKLICKALQLDATTSYVLKALAVEEPTPLDGWFASARLVKQCGGQIVFGWALYENDDAIKGEARVVWCDAGSSMYTSHPVGPTVFVPDARVRAAFRVAGRGPPDCIWWK